ncbi:hypothetical protein HDE_12781 [Halotydeus destructor]|nr:hypothetical protein HDE_12781 [Halotydeus destructor]
MFTCSTTWSSLWTTRFPNAIAILTGQRIPWNESGILSEVDLKPNYFDKKLPYVFDDFKDGGYVTGFLEDMGLIGVFNYGKKGFIEPPTDWYPKPFWVQMYPERGDFDLYDVMKNPSRYCFEQNGAKFDIFVNQTLEFMAKHEAMKQPYFLMSFHSQVTHENFNNFQLLDQSMADFINGAKPYLDNTIFIFAGDHGPRYGPMVFQPLGQLENRMPLVTMRIPESLDTKHPHLRQLLTANQRSLLTHYDVYALLKDVATGSFTLKLEPGQLSHINPSRTLIPSNRSCSDAGIDAIYCVCDNELHVEYLNVADRQAISQTMVKYLASIGKTTTSSFTFSEIRIIVPRHREHFEYIVRVAYQVDSSDMQLENTVLTSVADGSHIWTVQH